MPNYTLTQAAVTVDSTLVKSATYIPKQAITVADIVERDALPVADKGDGKIIYVYSNGAFYVWDVETSSFVEKTNYKLGTYALFEYEIPGEGIPLVVVQNQDQAKEYTIFEIAAPETTPKEATLTLMCEASGAPIFTDISMLNYNSEKAMVIRIQERGSGTLVPFKIQFNDGSGKYDAFIVKPDEKVGIGKSDPIANLHVNSAGVCEVIIEADTDNVTETDHPVLTFKQDGGSIIGQIGAFDGENYFKIKATGANNPLGLWTNGAERVSIGTGGNIDVLTGDVVRLRTPKTPASASAIGNAGEICWDSSYVYVCVATDTWKRSELSTW
jgi:hypothetical protein